MPTDNPLPATDASLPRAATVLRAWEAFRDAAVHWEAGEREQAIGAIDRALSLHPDFPEALSMGAFILGALGNQDASLQFYMKSLALNPRQPVVLANVGKAWFGQDEFVKALQAFEAALELEPESADFWNSKAGALRKLGQMEASLGAAQTALRLRADFPEAALNRANALMKLDRLEEALSAYEGVLGMKADYAAAHCGRALCLRALGRIDEAMIAFEHAEKLGAQEAISGKACLQLALGDFERGWEGYEARWLDGKILSKALGGRFRTWRGPSDPSKRVLVLNDHGMGDTFQFARYLPLMARAGVETAFACPKSMHRMLSSIDGIRLVEPMQSGDGYDAQIALSSLPWAFSTRLETIPAGVPYLHAEAELRRTWAARIGAHGFRVGVVWQGNLNPEVDVARSIPLKALAPLASVDQVRLISLQKGAGQSQFDELNGAFCVETLEHLDEGSDAFVDTAAAMMSLDIVVTCDTSIAHLAGALGRPVWVALKKEAEWRWLVDREDSPWYPTMRLFRQQTRGDWNGVFQAMRLALDKIARRRAGERLVAIPGSIGELIDKITILEIKALRAIGGPQQENVRRELDLLERCLADMALGVSELPALRRELSQINRDLWGVEDEIRQCEKASSFGPRFVELARAVYVTNDRRAAVKYRINDLAMSAIVEEKFYG